MNLKPIYHICRSYEWDLAKDQKYYNGSSQDQKDGFIHFSTGEQIRESAAKHRGGQDNLVLIEVDPKELGGSLKWELSGSNSKFPHLYSKLPLSAVIRTYSLRLDSAGNHMFPQDWNL